MLQYAARPPARRGCDEVTGVEVPNQGAQVRGKVADFDLRVRGAIAPNEIEQQRCADAVDIFESRSIDDDRVVRVAGKRVERRLLDRRSRVRSDPVRKADALGVVRTGHIRCARRHRLTCEHTNGHGRNLRAEGRSNNRLPVHAEFHNGERRSIHQRETQLLPTLDCSHREWLLDWLHARACTGTTRPAPST